MPPEPDWAQAPGQEPGLERDAARELAPVLVSERVPDAARARA